jgi:hypothetical protein
MRLVSDERHVGGADLPGQLALGAGTADTMPAGTRSRGLARVAMASGVCWRASAWMIPSAAFGRPPGLCLTRPVRTMCETWPPPSGKRISTIRSRRERRRRANAIRPLASAAHTEVRSIGRAPVRDGPPSARRNSDPIRAGRSASPPESRGARSTNPATTDSRNASSLWFPMVACLIGLADNHTRDRRSTRRLVMPSYRETSSGLRRLEYRLLPSS